MAEKFGYNENLMAYHIKPPIKVFITIGKPLDEDSMDYPYYEVLCIEKRE